MHECKKCGCKRAMRNGIVGGRQRDRCRECGCNFREGDERTNEKVTAKKALCILMYAMAKGSFRMMGRLLGINHTLVYRWIRSYGESLLEPTVAGNISQMEFDEMWHFAGSKKQALGIKAIARSTRRFNVGLMSHIPPCSE